VKIRGFRIELGEIETALSNHPQVQQSIVLVTEDSQNNKRLVAYLVSQDESLTNVQIREYLQQQLPTYMVPSVFIFLESLPLTSNGKVDRKALLALEIGNEYSQEYVAPRTMTEHIIANIFSEVLAISNISIHDNFFELGGHSLLAIRLMSQIQQYFHINLPLSALFQNPTVEGLGIMVTADPSETIWSPLVPIKPQGILPPFFCVPGGGGNVLYFNDLAQLLDRDQPFYGLQAHGLDGETEPLTSVEEIASHYIKSIKTVQPTGPYFLGGHSFGGKVAFEMSQQLKQQGENVAMIAILDTNAPSPIVETTDENRAADENRAILIFEAAEIIEELMGESLLVSGDILDPLTDEQQLYYFKQQLERIGFLPPQTDIKIVRGLLQVFQVQGEINYFPKDFAAVPIALFRAQDQNDDYPELSEPAPDWGWNEFSDGETEIHYVPGSHLSMMTKPNVQILAKKLQESIDRARQTIKT
jgi:thioesterase domain-containing protein/acyl carrier protein